MQDCKSRVRALCAARILLVTAFVGVCPCLSAVPEMPKVRTDHPRIFFNAETWPELAAKAKGPLAQEVEKLLAECDKVTDTPVCTGTEMPPCRKRLENGVLVDVPHSGDVAIPIIHEFGAEASKCALAWRFTGDRKYLEKTKRLIAANGKGYNDAYANGRNVNWYCFSRINTFCAYDWIAETLTPAEKEELLRPLLKHMAEATNWKLKILRRDRSGPKAGNYGIPGLLWYAGLAMAGEGVDDAFSDKLLREGWANGVELFEFRAHAAGDDGPFNGGVVEYSMGMYPYSQFNFLRSLKSATGRDFAAEYPGLALFPNWIWWSWIPNADDERAPQFAGFGDSYHSTAIMSTEMLYEHMCQYASVYRDLDPASARLAASLAQLAPNRDKGKVFPIYRFLLEEGACAAPIPKTTLEQAPLKARHFESVGQFLMRSGWTPNDTFAAFTAGSLPSGHKHNDENSFVIYRYDALALDSGTRANQTDYNLKHYYAQTVAHNAILIHGENEPLSFHWGIELKDPKYNFNYGGQRDQPVAHVEAYETNDRFTYVAADAAVSYGPKCRRALRQFVHVQPNVFVVYDRVETDKPRRVEYLLHTQNEPEVKDGLLKVDSRNGRLYQQTILPRTAVYEKVGGPGREWWANGRNWEVDEKYLAQSCAECRKAGRGPYFGAWRLEVKSSDASSQTTFLHVLTATDSASGVPVKADAAASSDGTREGVTLVLSDGRDVQVLFNRAGQCGGMVQFAGETSARMFSTSVLKQSGAGFDAVGEGK